MPDRLLGRCQSGQQFCRELIPRARPNFSFLRLYVAREIPAPLVAVLALFAFLEELFSSIGAFPSQSSVMTFGPVPAVL